MFSLGMHLYFNFSLAGCLLDFLTQLSAQLSPLHLPLPFPLPLYETIGDYRGTIRGLGGLYGDYRGL